MFDMCCAGLRRFRTAHQAVISLSCCLKFQTTITSNHMKTRSDADDLAREILQVWPGGMQQFQRYKTKSWYARKRFRNRFNHAMRRISPYYVSQWQFGTEWGLDWRHANY